MRSSTKSNVPLTKSTVYPTRYRMYITTATKTNGVIIVSKDTKRLSYDLLLRSGARKHFADLLANSTERGAVSSVT